MTLLYVCRPCAADYAKAGVCQLCGDSLTAFDVPSAAQLWRASLKDAAERKAMAWPAPPPERPDR